MLYARAPKAMPLLGHAAGSSPEITIQVFITDVTGGWWFVGAAREGLRLTDDICWARGTINLPAESGRGSFVILQMVTFPEWSQVCLGFRFRMRFKVVS